MSGFTQIKYPISIQFRTNENSDSDWGADMSKYITSLTIDQQVEDDPFVFIENEVQIEFWDFDDKFIQSSWSENISELEIRGISEGKVIFQGWLEIPQTHFKTISLSINSNTKEGKLYFGTGLSRFDAVIFTTPTTNEIQWKQYDPQYGDYNDRGTAVYLNKVDDLLYYFLPNIVVDCSNLPIYNEGVCYHRIDKNYFDVGLDNEKKTILGFIKDLCKMYDSYVNYDTTTNTLTFYKRENLDDTIEDTITENQLYTLNRNANISQYTGIQVVYDTPPRDTFIFNTGAIVLQPNAGTLENKVPSNVYMGTMYVKYNNSGGWEQTSFKDWREGRDRPDKVVNDAGSYFTSEVYFPYADSHSFLFGNESTILDINVPILGYLVVDLTDTNIPDSIGDSIVPNAAIKKLVRNNLFNGVLRYLKPTTEFTMEFKNDIPSIGSTYKILDGSVSHIGHIVDVNYQKSQYETISVKWNKIYKYQAEPFVTGV